MRHVLPEILQFADSQKKHHASQRPDGASVVSAGRTCFRKFSLVEALWRDDAEEDALSVTDLRESVNISARGSRTIEAERRHV